MKSVKVALVSLLCFFSINALAYQFENTTCSIIKNKSDPSPSVITAIKLGKVRHLSEDQMSKIGVWNQKTNSNEFIDVEIYINDGNVNRSFYRLVDGTLHQSFPSRDGQFTFRRIVPSIAPDIGRYDHIEIKGSSLRSTLLNTISCEKNLF